MVEKDLMYLPSKSFRWNKYSILVDFLDIYRILIVPLPYVTKVNLGVKIPIYLGPFNFQVPFTMAIKVLDSSEVVCFK